MSFFVEKRVFFVEKTCFVQQMCLWDELLGIEITHRSILTGIFTVHNILNVIGYFCSKTLTERIFQVMKSQ